MKVRARHIHLAEAVLDTLVALAINATLSYFILHLMGHEVTIGQQSTLTVVLTVLSIIRKYMFRRISSNIIGRIYENLR